MFNLYADLDSVKSLIIALAMAAFLLVAVGASILGYLISFKKHEFKEVFINKKVLISVFSILGSNIPVVATGFVLQFVVENIPSYAVIILIVLGFALTVGVGIYIFLFLHTMAIGIDDKEITFLGERILIRKISNVRQNTKLNQITINYIEGTRSKKKCRYSLASQAGQFILNNVSLLNQEVEVDPVEPSSTLKRSKDEASESSK
ncbi:transmembrane protein [Spiroplasma syrphidicola EA-1]|uniref:Transmembrane protein n=1 Tax=Spiroplasma syrphidicola EA-1 TaxID=1276229 RepID=R4UJE3_9MOLU|nr:hypothetical protein [Spiroplasma syrphidicola]AGM26250.1 transmembrane protein [Spiroplasma syrphidicola EA-1]